MHNYMRMQALLKSRFELQFYMELNNLLHLSVSDILFYMPNIGIKMIVYGF